LDSPSSATFGQSSVFPGDGVTVVVSLDKGVVPAASVKPLLDEKWSIVRAFSVTTGTAIPAGVLLVVIGAIMTRLMYRTGRDRRSGPKGADERMGPMDRHQGPVQYRPPDDARPAQVGVLIDERADPLDVTATIIDLGVRGYLKIEEVEKKSLFHKADWQLTK